MGRALRIAGGVVATLGFLVAVATLVLTGTDWGRERVRMIAIDRLAAQVAGRVRVGELSGNLLSGATLEDVEITDSAGAPFLIADTVALQYSLRSLVSEELHFTNVRLVRPIVVLDRPPGGMWNFERLFPQDTTASDTVPGFGSWVTLEDVRIADGTIIVRTPWSPPRENGLPAGGVPEGGRLQIVRTTGGYQTVHQLLDLDAHLPFVRLADPDSATRRADIASLSTIALLFEPPVLRIEDMAGTLLLGDEALRIVGLRARLPGTGLALAGTYPLDGSGAVSLRTRVDPLDFRDFRWLRPSLPDGGGSVREAVLVREPAGLRVEAEGLRVRAEGATVVGHLAVRLGDDPRLGDTDLEFTRVDTRLLERFADVESPLAGVMEGHVRMQGRPEALRVDGRIAFVERSGQRSVVLADGTVGAASGALRMDDLQLELEPLRVSLLRQLSPGLPLDGTITGDARLNGSTGRVRATLAVTHTASTGTSVITGDAVVATGVRPWFDLDLRTPRLALATVGRFAPEAELHGSARGDIAARGTIDDFGFDADLALNGSAVAAAGRLGLGGPAPRYDVTARLEDFDAAAASARAPATNLTGVIAAAGRGFDPATAHAVVRADLADVAIDSVHADSTIVRLRVADGLLTADTARIHMASASLDLEGSFGLVAGRTGEMRYALAVDSVGDFADYVPADTGLVIPRPLLEARRIAEARADSTRVATETMVERAATGQPPEPELGYDTVAPIPRDSVAGSLRAEGVLAGNLEAIDVRGTAQATGLVAAGFALSSGQASWTIEGLRTPDARLRVEAGADSVRALGFAFDSAATVLEYAGVRDRGTGSTELAVFQDPDRDYRLRSEFRLALDEHEATLTELALRFDTATWNATGTGKVLWGPRGITVRSIALENEEGGSIRVDGLLPVEDEADLHVQVDQLQIAHITALLQDTVDAHGLLDLDATIRGTRAAPTLAATFALDEVMLDDRPLPDLAADLAYANASLEADAVVLDDSLRLLTARAAVPVDLALERAPGPRLLDRPMRITAHADSLPLEALPSFTDAVADVRGRVRGDIDVSGTPRSPDVSGAIDLDLASLRIVSPGIFLTDVAGTLELANRVAYVDSLVAHSDGGSIRAWGALDIADLSRPGFYFDVESSRAILLDNERGRVRADARLAIEGPYDGLTVTGDVDVRSGVIQAPETGKRRVTNLDDPTALQGLDTTMVAPELIPRPNPLLANLSVDVDVHVARDTWVRNSDGNVEVYTPEGADPVRVRLDRGKEIFSLMGVINADRGEYGYAGHIFQLSSGSVTFLGGSELDPLLQLTAQYDVPRRGRESLMIQIHVLGSLSEPRVALESNAQPPLPESDLIAYLAFGHSSSSLLDLQGSGVSADGSGIEALGALAQQQLGSLGIGAAIDVAVSDIERQGTGAGLDVFRIRPAQLPGEVAFEGYFENLLRGTEIEAGKYLTPRFFVAAQGRPSSALPGLHFEYRLSDELTWEGAWEPRFLPSEPSLSSTASPTQARTLGSFLYWRRRF